MHDPEAWVEINEGIDRQRDFIGSGGIYAQCGPESDGRWSWALLRYNPDGDPDYIDDGFAIDEVAAKREAERVFGELPPEQRQPLD